MDISNQIHQLADKYFQEIIEIRRHIHQYPELSKKEKNTASFISKELDKIGIPHQKNIGGYGIVGLIEGEHDGKTIGLRADMDALPIEETNTHDFVSKNPGVMHACGHDAHIASLLGAAKIIHVLKAQLKGNVKLLFQPSEESYPGGAIQMIDEGVLDNPKVDFMIGQHVFPELEAGEIGIKAGMFMASTDEIYITIKGKGGHGATPHLNINPIYIGSQAILNLQQLIDKYAPKHIPSILSFGRFVANGRTNIVPNTATIEGTLRTFDEEWRKEAHQRITQIVEETAREMGAKANVFIDKGYPFLSNEEMLTKKIKEHLSITLGNDKIKDLDYLMTAEDFAYFSQKVPSCFLNLGCANRSKGIYHNLHTSDFEIDESCLHTGMKILSSITIYLCNEI